MWKTIIVSMLLLFNFGISYAAIPSDLSTALDKPKDLNLLFEVGLSHKDFTSAYQQIYIETRKLESKQPQYTEDLDKLLDIYKDIDEYWTLNSETDTISKDSMFYKQLNLKYPELFNNVKASHYNTSTYWFTKLIVSELMKYPKLQVTTIESKYDQ